MCVRFVGNSVVMFVLLVFLIVEMAVFINKNAVKHEMENMCLVRALFEVARLK